MQSKNRPGNFFMLSYLPGRVKCWHYTWKTWVLPVHSFSTRVRLLTCWSYWPRSVRRARDWWVSRPCVRGWECYTEIVPNLHHHPLNYPLERLVCVCVCTLMPWKIRKFYLEELHLNILNVWSYVLIIRLVKLAKLNSCPKF